MPRFRLCEKGVELLDLSLMTGFRLRQMGVDVFDFRLMPAFRLRKSGVELLDFSLVTSFRLRQMGVEFFDLNLVASFRFFEKLAVEMFDLRDPFWNNGIQPADRSRKQIGFLRFCPSAGWRCRHSRLVTFPRRCLRNQSAIKLD